MRPPTPFSLVLFVAVVAVAAQPAFAQASSVTIYDAAGTHVIKDSLSCDHLIYGEDGVGGGYYMLPGPPYNNVWLIAPTGTMTASSDSLTTAVAIQYHSSDDNDGITDIYVDDMFTPLVRIDTYERGTWYVEISDLPMASHTVKVAASGNSTTTGVVPSPHRLVPAIGDNDIWYFCFSNTPTVNPEGEPDPAKSGAQWLGLAGDTAVLACPAGDGSYVGVMVKDCNDDPLTNTVVTVELVPACGMCRCATVTAVTDSILGFALVPAAAGLDGGAAAAACCQVSTVVRCRGVTIPWNGTGGSLVDTREWISPDLTGDCFVDLSDYMMVFIDLGTTACRSDFDRNGLVEQADLDIVTAHFAQSCSQPVGVADNPSGEPRTALLEQNYPNPFSPATRIAFHAPAPGAAIVRIHSAAGRLVRTLRKDCSTAGRYELTWDGLDERGRPVASGVYFCRLEMGGSTEARRMVLIR